MKRFLRSLFLVGAVYDLALSAGMLLAPGWVAGFLGTPLPEEMFHFRMSAFLLLPLAGIYFSVYANPHRYKANIYFCILARLGGGLFILGHVWFGGSPAVYALIGAVDTAFGLGHMIFLKYATGKY